MSKLLTDKQKKKIIADFVDNDGNYSETARMNGVTDMGVRRIVQNNKDCLKMLEEKKKKNTQNTLEYMDTQHETKKRILDKLLKAIEEKSENVDMFTNIKDLATAYGIIVDKELKVLEINSKLDIENSQEFVKAKELIVKIRGLDNNE